MNTITGMVKLQLLNKGSKSERTSHIIENDTEHRVLRQRGGNAMFDPFFNKFINKTVTVTGADYNGNIFIVDSIEES